MNLLRVLTLLGFLLAAHSAFAASFADLVRNTKETDSILLRGADSTAYDETYPIGSAERTRIEAAFAAAFASTSRQFDSAGQTSPAVCEPKFLSVLATEMARQGVPSDSVHLGFALAYFRVSNLIDDVVLLPLLATLPAWTSLGYREDEWNSDRSEIQCPTETYTTLAVKIKKAKARKFKRKHLTQEIDRLATEERSAGEKRYLQVEIAWLKALKNARFDVETPFALPTALEKMARIKNTDARAKTGDAPTKIMSKRRKKAGGLSNRLILYRTYNAFQITRLVETYQTYVKDMDIVTAQMELVVRYTDGTPNKVIPLDTEEQRRAAARILHKSIVELRNSGTMAGTQPTFDDMIIAAVETGYIHAEELDQALGVDDLWNPQLTGWQRVWSVVKKYGTTALVLIPNPYTFWASLAITLVETVSGGQKELKPADDGISIF